jgi:hypothetical protein
MTTTVEVRPLEAVAPAEALDEITIVTVAPLPPPALMPAVAEPAPTPVARGPVDQLPALVCTLGASALPLTFGALTHPWRSPAARILRPLAAMLGVLPWLYLLGLRRRHLRWGATDAEARRMLPYDDAVARPQYEATHAITIDAPVASVWPWLVQIGYQRAGFYSYDAIERALGLHGLASAETILPEFQSLGAGDTIPLNPAISFPVIEVTPPHLLALAAHGPVPGAEQVIVDLSWVFILEAVDTQTTRLLVRFRGQYQPRLRLGILAYLFLELGHFVMEQKMLRGLKQRAEGLA